MLTLLGAAIGELDAAIEEMRIAIGEWLPGTCSLRGCSHKNSGAQPPGGARSLRSRPVIRMILTSDGPGEVSRNGQPACSKQPAIRRKAPRPPASQKPSAARSTGHRPAVTVDDLPEVPDGQAGGDIQLAADVHDGLASRPDPVTQLERTGSVLLQSAAHRHPRVEADALAALAQAKRVCRLSCRVLAAGQITS